jgi:hypothetical protein
MSSIIDALRGLFLLKAMSFPLLADEIVGIAISTLKEGPGSTYCSN